MRKMVKTSLLLFNVTDVDDRNSRLFTNKGHFSSTLIGVLAKLDEEYLIPIALTGLLE